MRVLFVDDRQGFVSALIRRVAEVTFLSAEEIAVAASRTFVNVANVFASVRAAPYLAEPPPAECAGWEPPPRRESSAGLRRVYLTRKPKQAPGTYG